MLAAICVIFLLAILIDGGVSGPGQVLWPLAWLMVVWVVFLRPCIRLTQKGVSVENLVRDVHFGWPAVDLIEQRWNLKLYDEHGKGYGSWAITAQRPRRAPRRPTGSGLGALGALGSGIGPVDSDDPDAFMQARRGSAARVAQAIRDGQMDYASATQRDAAYTAADTVAVRPAWPAIGALALAVLFVVISIL
ncbi:MAG: hypothetical protein L0H26_10640, partial [Microlunatus sp.]|nr:hypothetical protein [Microlunatus sp.]